MYIIYLLRSSDGVGYVGRTKYLKQRLRTHRSGTQKLLISEAINSLGWDDFSIEILEHDIQTMPEAKRREEYWILECRTLYPFGYNIKLGDRGAGSKFGYKVSASMKRSEVVSIARFL